MFRLHEHVLQDYEWTDELKDIGTSPVMFGKLQAVGEDQKMYPNNFGADMKINIWILNPGPRFAIVLEQSEVRLPLSGFDSFSTIAAAQEHPLKGIIWLKDFNMGYLDVSSYLQSSGTHDFIY